MNVLTFSMLSVCVFDALECVLHVLCCTTCSSFHIHCTCSLSFVDFVFLLIFLSCGSVAVDIF